MSSRTSVVNAQPMARWSDARVLEVAESTMPRSESRRLSDLLDRQQAGRLRQTERVELNSLMKVYRKGLLRKAQALAEAVRRGLMEPLKP